MTHKPDLGLSSRRFVPVLTECGDNTDYPVYTGAKVDVAGDAYATESHPESLRAFSSPGVPTLQPQGGEEKHRGGDVTAITTAKSRAELRSGRSLHRHPSVQPSHLDRPAPGC